MRGLPKPGKILQLVLYNLLLGPKKKKKKKTDPKKVHSETKANDSYVSTILSFLIGNNAKKET